MQRFGASLADVVYRQTGEHLKQVQQLSCCWLSRALIGNQVLNGTITHCRLIDRQPYIDVLPGVNELVLLQLALTTKLVHPPQLPVPQQRDYFSPLSGFGSPIRLLSRRFR